MDGCLRRLVQGVALLVDEARLAWTRNSSGKLLRLQTQTFSNTLRGPCCALASGSRRVCIATAVCFNVVGGVNLVTLYSCIPYILPRQCHYKT